MTTATENYELLLACYRSGQITEQQWQEHLRDEVLFAWLKRRIEIETRGSGPVARSVHRG